MILLGAGGHAKEVVDEWVKAGLDVGELEFFDNITGLDQLFGRPVWKELDHWTGPKEFIVATGNPAVRRMLFNRFVAAGHIPKSFIACTAQVSTLDVTLGEGLNVMSNVVIGPGTIVGEGTLLNSGAHVHHDATIGAFCEISPRACILGRVEVGADSQLGAGAIVLPDIRIGRGVVVGAATLVNRNVPDLARVAGVPARPVERKE